MFGAILILLACVFGLAGVSKLGAPDAFRSTLRKLLPFWMVVPTSIIVPVTELALAALLLSGLAPRLGAAISIAVLVGFTVVLRRMWYEGVKGCGCFGEASESAPSGIARNLVLITTALFVVLSKQPVQTYGPSLGILLGQLTLVLGALCTWPAAVALVQRRNMIFNQGAIR